MGFSVEGEIHIPLEEFWAFVNNYIPNDIGEVVFGVPKVSPDAVDMIINCAASNDGNPADWAKKPSCLKEWEDLRKKDSQ